MIQTFASLYLTLSLFLLLLLNSSITIGSVVGKIPGGVGKAAEGAIGSLGELANIPIPIKSRIVVCWDGSPLGLNTYCGKESCNLAGCNCKPKQDPCRLNVKTNEDEANAEAGRLYTVFTIAQEGFEKVVTSGSLIRK